MSKKLSVTLTVALAILSGCGKTVLSGRNIYTLKESGCICSSLPAELTEDDFMLAGKSWIAEEAAYRLDCEKLLSQEKD